MASLSDFQQPATARSTAADALMAASSSKIRNGAVNWRNTRVVASEGYQEQPLYQLERAFDANDRRQRLHHVLDQLIGDDDPTEETESNEPVGEALGVAEKFGEVGVQAAGMVGRAGAALMESAAQDTNDRRARLHAALDTMLDAIENRHMGTTQNEILAEPSALEQDAEPEEEDDDDEPESFDAAIDASRRRLRSLLHGSDALDVQADMRRDRERQRHATVDHGAARVISPRREVRANAGYVTDAAFIAQHLDPNELCVEAENRLHDISLRRQADDCKRSYWSGLFYFLSSQPAGSRIRDVKNKVCLSTLLMHTVGGANGVFGV